MRVWKQKQKPNPNLPSAGDTPTHEQRSNLPSLPLDPLPRPPPPTCTALRIALYIGFYVLVVTASIRFAVTNNLPDDGGRRELPPRSPVPRTDSLLMLEDILAGNYRPTPSNSTWHGKRVLYRNAETGNLMLVDTILPDYRVVMRYNYPGLAKSHTQQLSADGRFVLLEYPLATVYTHSRLSLYELHAVPKDKEPYFVAVVTKERDKALLRYATFGPTGSTVIFAQNNNIYYWDLSNIDSQPTEDWMQSIRTVPVGRDDDDIYNGIADLSYETEILHQTQMIWPSPDGSKLAYLVLEMKPDIPKRYFTRNTARTLQGVKVPESHRFAMHHPMPGGPIPCPHLLVYNMQQQQSDETLGKSNDDPSLYSFQIDSTPEKMLPIGTVAVHPQQGELNNGFILTAIKWVSANRLLIVWMTRSQRIASVQMCNWSSGTIESACEMHMHYEILSGWLLVQDIHYDPIAEQLAVVLQVARKSDTDTENEELRMTVALLSHKPIGWQPNEAIVALNDNDVNVERIVYWSIKSHWLFYLASEPKRSEQLHLYAVSTVLGAQSAQCLTCEPLLYFNSYNDPQRLAYTHFDAHFNAASTDARLCLVLESQGPLVPRADVFSLDENGTQYLELEHQLMLHRDRVIEERVAAIGSDMPQVLFKRFTVPIGRDVRLRLVVPASFSEGNGRRYPLLVHENHRAPGTYSGTSEFAVDWMTWMVATRGIVVAQIDGMGSSRQNSNLMYSVYLMAGRYEAQDLSLAVEWLVNHWGHADSARMGILGHGFGAYTSGLMLSLTKVRKFAHWWNCMALVSPLHEWTQIGAFYAERYMNYPDVANNIVGYAIGDLDMEDWPGKALLLVHARAHELWEQEASKDLERRMEIIGLDFEMMVYPNVSEAQLRQRRHVDRRLSEFFHRCLIDYCYF